MIRARGLISRRWEAAENPDRTRLVRFGESADCSDWHITSVGASSLLLLLPPTASSLLWDTAPGVLAGIKQFVFFSP